jgi:hypothetical protein
MLLVSAAVAVAVLVAGMMYFQKAEIAAIVYVVLESGAFRCE